MAADGTDISPHAVTELKTLLATRLGLAGQFHTPELGVPEGVFILKFKFIFP
jgi:hypothetical protein|tara:strand:+ start:66 stop:221 length:156 start_codon:yes stop_codon:yes gene_type:complete